MNNMYSAQVLWDEGMADTAMKFMTTRPPDPKEVFVVIAGSGHVLYKQGINFRIASRSGADGVTMVMLQSDQAEKVSKGIGDFAYLSEADREIEGAIPVGRAKMSVEVAPDLKIDTYTYKPENYKDGPIVMVFHGTLRNADEYRADSEDLARKWGALVVVPTFDSKRFPGRKYNYGGILNQDRTAAPKEEWTYAYVPKIVDAVRTKEGNSRLPYYLLGHSAGGQFLVRMAAFMQNGATRIIAANPGSELFPALDRPFGYGYGNLPAELSDEVTIRRYLAQPLTLLLGTADDHPDEYFDDSAEAMKQGKSRYERGKNVFAFAQSLAKQKGWTFNWKLIEVKGVAHDHKKMFDSMKTPPK
jgi:poly(3-hydroxybutyrate) depolymerase